MKILIINKYWYKRGGADRYAMWLASELRRRGHEVVIFSVDHRENEKDKNLIVISGVETEKHSLRHAPRTMARMLWSFEAQKTLNALIEREKPDIAHVHNIYTQMSPSVLPVLKRHGIPVVSHVHDYGMISANYSLFDKRGIDRVGSFMSVIKRKGIHDSRLASTVAAFVFAVHKTLRVYRKNIDKLIFTSHFVSHLFEAKGWEGGKGVMIPYVVDVHGEDEKPQEDDGYLFFVGRLHKTKGVDVLIEAARVSGVPLKIAGDGPDRTRLQKQVGAMTNIEFLGALDNKKTLSYMRRARACVVPSVWWEPFGMVAIEPQAVGTPVIASNTGGLAELVIHERTGLLVEPGSVHALAGAMKRLFDDPDGARHMGKLAKRKFESHYGIEEHMRKIMEVYESLVR